MSESASSRPAAPVRSERALVASRATRTSTACAACRGRRVKCTGGPPCERCVANKIECVVDGTLDGRRKIAVKRKLDELERDRELLHGLVTTIRMGDRSQLAQVLNLIRSEAPMEEVYLCIEDQLDTLREGRRSSSRASAELERGSDTSSQGSSRSRDRRAALSVQRLCDTPIINVPARPWTTVTDDDEFVSHLVSLWFTWQYPYFHWLDRDMFVDDMKSARLDSSFCSPFLVNIMLAEACPFSYYPEAYARPGDPSSVGEHFYAEAKRCLEAEEGRISLTSVQGACMLYTCTSLKGKDSLGSIFMNQAIHMARELGLFATVDPSWTEDKEQDEAAQRMRRARDLTAWAVYDITTLTSLSVQRQSPLRPPRRPMPADDHATDGVLWSPYPRQGPSKPIHLGCLFKEMCEVAHITHAVTDLLFADDGRPSGAPLERAIEDIYARLQSWYGRIPDCLSLGESPLPHILDLHMHYHHIVITIFGFLRSPVPAGPPSSSPSSSSPSSPSAHRADKVCLSSALEIARLMDVVRREWGLDSVTVMMTQFISVAIFILMEDLPSPASQTAFIDLCVAARSFSRRWALGKSMLQLVQLTAKDMQISLPRETAVLFEDFESRTWKPTERKRLGGGGGGAYSSSTAAAKRDKSKMSDVLVLNQLLDHWDDVLLSNPQERADKRTGKRSRDLGQDAMTDD